MLSLSVYFISIAYFFLLIEIGPTLNLSLINLSRLIVQVRQDKVRGRFTAVIDNLQMTAKFLIQPSFIKGPYIYDSTQKRVRGILIFVTSLTIPLFLNNRSMLEEWTPTNNDVFKLISQEILKNIHERCSSVFEQAINLHQNNVKLTLEKGFLILHVD